jgi:hypothetical protein
MQQDLKPKTRSKKLYIVLFILLFGVFVCPLITLLSWLTLQYTGFCFQEMRYVSKNEMIDKALNEFVRDNCIYEYNYKNNIKNIALSNDQINEALNQCSISLESLRKEAPQCFTDDRPDKCKGDITYFNWYAGVEKVIKRKDAVVYEYSSYFYNAISKYPILFHVGSWLAYTDGYFVNGCNKDYCIPCD